MPTYTFRDTKTGQEFDRFMTYADRQALLENNPDYEAVVTAPAIVSGVSTTQKVDGGFNDMLSRIARSNPTSQLAETHGDKGIRATKVREAVNKQKMRQLKSMQ